MLDSPIVGRVVSAASLSEGSSACRFGAIERGTHGIAQLLHAGKTASV